MTDIGIFSPRTDSTGRVVYEASVGGGLFVRLVDPTINSTVNHVQWVSDLLSAGGSDALASFIAVQSLIELDGQAAFFVIDFGQTLVGAAGSSETIFGYREGDSAYGTNLTVDGNFTIAELLNEFDVSADTAILISQSRFLEPSVAQHYNQTVRPDGMYRLSDLPDNFFQENMGLSNYQAYVQQALIHEILHASEHEVYNEPFGSRVHLNGHEDIIRDIFAQGLADGDAISINVLSDSVESRVVAVLLARGVISQSDDSYQKYIDWREEGYQTALDELYTPGDIRTFGDLKAAIACGYLNGRGRRLVIGADGNLYVQQDAVVIGDLDVGGTLVSAAAALGSTLGRRLFGDNVLAGTVSGAVFGQIASQLSAEILDAIGNTSQTVRHIANRNFEEFGIDVAGATVGALTSYLVGEVFSELGIGGFAGEALQTATSTYLSTIASNIIKQQPWNVGLAGANLLNVAGSFLGSKLASFVTNFETVGGQIGFSVGGTVGGIAFASIFASSLPIVANFLAPGVGAFVGALLGGLIGSLLGGTPESGAHVVWNASSGQFELGTTWADDWGAGTATEAAIDRAENTAITTGDVLNRIITGLGSTASYYENPTAIGDGAYGQRGNEWVYWAAGENNGQSFSTYLSQNPDAAVYDTPLEIVNHGLQVALQTVNVRGGDLYLKRALYLSIEANQADGAFDFSQLLGDLAIGADLSFYKENRPLIDATIALDPTSALAQGWVLTLLRSAEMGLDRFYRSDFYGGLGGFLEAHPIGQRPNGAPSDFVVAWGANGDLVIRGENETLPTGSPVMPGSLDTYFGEARWAGVIGPGTEAITAMETGQIGSTTAYGGGAARLEKVPLDKSKQYEFTLYFRKHDLTKHKLVFGTGNIGTVVDAVTGQNPTASTFMDRGTGWQQTELEDDRWYKVTAYILPAGESLNAQGEMGGIYDTVTGEKVGNVTNFAWDPDATETQTFLRFYNYADETLTGYSTYWYAPSIRIMEDNIAGPNLLPAEGWPNDPHSTVVVPDFANTMGYDGSGSTTEYSDIRIATGSAAVSYIDSSVVPSLEGPGITGSSRLSDDIFVGAGGNDTLSGLRGWDWLDGGAADDSIQGGIGNDVLIGRAGNDTLYGEDDADSLDGGDGNDSNYGGNGDDIIYYGAGQEVYDGGAGIDTISFEHLTEKLETSYGAKIYLYASGSQSSYIADDTLTGIENAIGSVFNDRLLGYNNINVLQGLAGDDSLHGYDDDDTLIGGSGADTLNGEDDDDTASYRTSAGGVEASLLTGEAEGSDAEGDSFVSIEHLEGSEFADVLQSGTVAGTLTGLGGNDLFLASEGATAYKGGDGIDTVEFTEATDAVTVNLSTGTGSYNWATGDTFESIENLIGSDNADHFTGTAGDERFQGGIGSDSLIGGGGTDSYVLQKGSAYDYVTDTGGDFDYVVLDGEIGLKNLYLNQSGSSLQIKGAGGGADDRIYVNSHFTASLPQNRLERLTFENGSSILIADISQIQLGTSSDETLTGTGGPSLIQGRSGNDSITSGIYNDVLIGGAGSDTLKGADGFDQYVFGRGSGLDRIEETGGSDTLIIADDISADELIFKYVGDDLYIGIKDPDDPELEANEVADRVLIKNQKVAGKSIEMLRFGLQNVSLPSYLGDVDGTNDLPSVPQTTLYEYADFYGGVVGTVEGFDPNGDALSYSVLSVSGGPSGTYSFVNGGPQLHTTAQWTQQGYGSTTVTIRVSDGPTTYTDAQITIAWRPDPNGGPLDPIVLDLDGDGVELIDPVNSTIEWDVNEDGIIDQLGWVGPDDAFLAFDRDGSGTINSLAEISFINDLEGAQTDLEGLRAFDLDFNDVADGVLDANDVWYNDFYVWQDANQNGVSEASELVKLADSDVKSINLTGVPTGQTVEGAEDNVIINIGQYEHQDGSHDDFGDVALGVHYGSSGSYGSGLHGGLFGNAFVGFGSPTTIEGGVITRGGMASLLEGKNGGGDPGLLDGLPDGALGGTVTPIVLDLDLDGLEVVALGRSSVLFDADGDGRKEWTGWFGVGDGVLAIDVNGDGAITNGREISFLSYKPGARTDLEGLTGLDSNGNGRIDSGDARYAELKVWRDVNMDGVSQYGELTSLSAAGVRSIELGGSGQPNHTGGNTIYQTATFMSGSGLVGTLGDVGLGYLELSDAQLHALKGPSATMAAAEMERMRLQLLSAMAMANDPGMGEVRLDRGFASARESGMLVRHLD